VDLCLLRALTIALKRLSRGLKSEATSIGGGVLLGVSCGESGGLRLDEEPGMVAWEKCCVADSKFY
jgi:hypothetical protein